MSGCHAATVCRCDSRADFDACPCCGYSAAGEPSTSAPAMATVQQQGALSTSAPAAHSEMGQQPITLQLLLFFFRGAGPARARWQAAACCQVPGHLTPLPDTGAEDYMPSRDDLRCAHSTAQHRCCWTTMFFTKKHKVGLPKIKKNK